MPRVRCSPASGSDRRSNINARSASSCVALLMGVMACLPTSVNGAETIQVPSGVQSIQAAIDQARTGDQIVVAPGRYLESIDLMGKSIVIRSSGGRDVTVIDGIGSRDSVIRCVRGEGRSTIISGFTVTGGTGNRSIYGPDATIGGGLLILESKPTIQDCRFEKNNVTYNGGGVYIGYECQPVIERCEFIANQAERGGGAYNSYSTSEFQKCRFIMNMASYGGGGMYNGNDSRPFISGCEFQANLAAYNGGGVYDYESNSIINDCVFTRNAANYNGGAVYNGYLSDIRLKRCTFLTPNDDIAGSGGFVLNPTAVVGACCLADACLQVSEIECIGAGGKYAGPKVNCDDAYVCPERCPSDLNIDGVVDASDLAYLLADMGACSPASLAPEPKRRPHPTFGLMDDLDGVGPPNFVTIEEPKDQDETLALAEKRVAPTAHRGTQ